MLSLPLTSIPKNIIHKACGLIQAFSIPLAAVFCLMIPLSALAAPETTALVTKVSTCDELQKISSGDYELVADIDCRGVNFTPIRTFTGSLHGLGHKISNLAIIKEGTDADSKKVGLFATTSNASIRDLMLEDVKIVGTQYVGALIGDAVGNTMVDGVQVRRGTVTVSTSSSYDNLWVGGLIGMLESGSSSIINNSSSSAAVSLQKGGRSITIGGLIGLLDASGSLVVDSSYATGAVKVEGISDTTAGGLIGSMGGKFQLDNHPSVKNSYATGNVTVNVSNGSNVGGLIGRNQPGGEVLNSYATGTVNVGGPNGIAGGLVGFNSDNSDVLNSYATGAVDAGTNGTSIAGGLVGVNYNQSEISNCYALGDVSGSDLIGGLVAQNAAVIENSYAAGKVVAQGGHSSGGLTGVGGAVNSYWDTQTSGKSNSGGGTGKTTAEMYQQSTYTDWNFVNTWGINEGKGYPFLLKVNVRKP